MCIRDRLVNHPRWHHFTIVIATLARHSCWLGILLRLLLLVLSTCFLLSLLATPFLTRWCRPRAGQTAITNTNIWTAVEECQAESATFDCPASQATYGPIEDWDVGAVTSLNNWGNGCTEDSSYKCGCASSVRFDSSALIASNYASGAGSVLPVLGLQ